MSNNILYKCSDGVFLINQYNINDYLIWPLLKADYLKQRVPVRVNYKLEVQTKMKLKSVFFVLFTDQV
jgi:hypothetical protein